MTGFRMGEGPEIRSLMKGMTQSMELTGKLIGSGDRNCHFGQSQTQSLFMGLYYEQHEMGQGEESLMQAANLCVGGISPALLIRSACNRHDNIHPRELTDSNLIQTNISFNLGPPLQSSSTFHPH